MSAFRELCLGPAGRAEVLQGNIAFAAGVVRAGIPSADGYPGTPSSEVIHRGLGLVQDLITVGWSVNEAVAAGVGLGHCLAGDDCVVTMKIPGLYQAGDVFTSSAPVHQGARSSDLLRGLRLHPQFHPAHHRSPLSVQKQLHSGVGTPESSGTP